MYFLQVKITCTRKDYLEWVHKQRSQYSQLTHEKQ